MKPTTKNYRHVRNLFAVLAMMTINVLAQLGILGGKTIQQISNQYPSLFTPHPLTFSIWMVIYILIGWFTIYQSINKDNETVEKISNAFFLSCLANIGWVVAFQFRFIVISLVFIMLLLFTLMYINSNLKQNDSMMYATFSIYQAWIAVATFANTFAVISSMELSSFYIQTLTAIAIAVITLVMLAKAIKDNNFLYVLTLMWGVFGILYQHLAASGFNGKYPTIILVSIGSLLVGAIAIIYISFANNTDVVNIDKNLQKGR